MGDDLSEGATGADVRALQDVLNFHIRRGEPLKVDGIFGPKTEERLKEFQDSNGLTVTGVVDSDTRDELYEVTDLPLPLVFMPRLQLNPPFGQTPSQPRGIQPPPLVPPLQWPGPPVPPGPPFSIGPSFSLLENSLTSLPDTGAAFALGLKVTVPTRKDPADPMVASRQAIIDLIDELPTTSKFKALLISTIPNPVTRPAPPPSGFKWGAAPLFNPLNPTGFGVKGNAQFMLRVLDGGRGLPNMVFGAWGDGKFFLNFDTKQGQSRPAVQADGTVFIGVKGIF